MTPRSAARAAATMLATALLAACARDVPLELATMAPLRSQLAVVPAGPLRVSDVVDLALASNPDLVATRARRGVARAQARASRILPNPSFAGAVLPLLAGVGNVTGWTVGLSQDVKSLITYRARQRAAGFAADQVDAEILWQEWQVAGQARRLAVDLIFGERSRPSLVEAAQLLGHRNDVLQAALAAGNATLVTAAPSLVGFQSARASLDALEQNQLSLRHQLNALLGLAPEAVVPLADDLDLPRFDAAAIRAGLAEIPDRRPDLLALRLGYAAQDAVVRQQILAQFPDLILGAGASSDNSGVINGGPQVTVGLPVFDRNQGNIAVAQATRAQLHAEYSARLAAVIGQVGATLREMEQLSAQLAIVRRDLPFARRAAATAATAFGAASLDERSYVDLVTNRFAKEREILTLELALIDRQVALQTLVGDGLPTVATLAEAPR